MNARRVSTNASEPKTSQAPRFLPLETISVDLASPPHTDRRPVFGVISNMSQTGACIIANRSLPVDAKVELAIASRRRPGVLKVRARVVWCAERLEPIREVVGYLTGVSFDSVDAESVADLLGCGIFQPVA